MICLTPITRLTSLLSLSVACVFLSQCAAPSPVAPATPPKPHVDIHHNDTRMPAGMTFNDFITEQNRVGRELSAQALRPELTVAQQEAELVRLTKRAHASGRIPKSSTCQVYAADGRVLWSSAPSQAGARGGRAEFEAELQKRMRAPGSSMTEMSLKYPDGTTKTFKR